MQENKEINFSLNIGNHSANSPTKLDLSITRNVEQVNEIFNRTQNLNRASDVVVEIDFNAKNLESIELGENISTLKNYLNMIKEPMNVKFTNLDSVNDTAFYYSASKLLRLTLGWEYDENIAEFRQLNKLVSNVIEIGFQNFDFAVEVNQRFPQSTSDVDEPKLTGKATFIATANENNFNNFMKEKKDNSRWAQFFPVLMFSSSKIELSVHSLDYAIDHGVLPWPVELPKFSGFVGLKQLLVPQLAMFYSSLKNDMQDGVNLIEDTYKKIYDSVSGIQSISIAFRGLLFKLKFENFDIFNGFMPDIDTIKELGGVDGGGLFD
jgi:hypothetical protein